MFPNVTRSSRESERARNSIESKRKQDRESERGCASEKELALKIENVQGQYRACASKRKSALVRGSVRKGEGASASKRECVLARGNVCKQESELK